MFIYLAAPLLIGLFGYGLALPFMQDDLPLFVTLIVVLVCLGMILLMLVGLMDVSKARLFVDENRIRSVSTLWDRELGFDEIRGYTVNEQYLFIEPLDKRKKRIRVSRYLGGFDELLLWVSQNFSNLDEQAAIREKSSILDDENIGLTQEAREERLLKARRTARVINWAGGLTGAWAFFYPAPYLYTMLACIVIPLAALAAVKLSRGLIRMDERKGSAFPSVIHAIIYPSLGIMLRGVLDYDIADYSNVWLPAASVALIFLFLLLIRQKEINITMKSGLLAAATLSIFLFAYGFGTVMHLNCYYDRSEPARFRAEVLGKRVSSGKTTSYYLDLSAWGPRKEPEDVSVDKDLYNRIEAGSEVDIWFRKGLLDIPWFIVTHD